MRLAATANAPSGARMYPAWATDDHANSRTIRCWRRATRLPTVMVSTASAANGGPATSSHGLSPQTTT